MSGEGMDIKKSWAFPQNPRNLHTDVHVKLKAIYREIAMCSHW